MWSKKRKKRKINPFPASHQSLNDRRAEPVRLGVSNPNLVFQVATGGELLVPFHAVCMIHVVLGRPCRSRNVAQTCSGQVEAGLAIGECPHDAGPAANLLHDPLQRIVGPDFPPVDVGKGVVG
jgi:hypothetical protein